MDDFDHVITDPGPNLDALIREYQLSGSLANGAANVEFCENTRRMRWPGQSPDGRKWDRDQPDGAEAQPWDGAWDTKVPTVDEVCNDSVAVKVVGYRRAELTADGIEAGDMEKAALMKTYMDWLIRKKLRRELKVEVELSAQYPEEYSYCIAYVGWEREISRRRYKIDLATLNNLGQAIAALKMQENAGAPDTHAAADLMEMAALQQIVLDPSREERAAELLQEVYRYFVAQEMKAKGFYEEEFEDQQWYELKPATAKKYVRELRDKGRTEMPLPYVCKHQPCVRIYKPWEQVIISGGGNGLQRARAIFIREFMSIAELRAKEAEGWDPTWIAEAEKHKGQMSTWATNANSEAERRIMGGTTFTTVKMPDREEVEIVYAYVRKADDDGVTGIWCTVFCPHVTRNPLNQTEDFVGKHEEIDSAHGRYPFVQGKREHLGRHVEDTRGVPEIAATWQNEEKCQRDMLANRSELELMPPIAVPKLGGLDYRLGPMTQVPVDRSSQDYYKPLLKFDGASPQMAVELIKLVGMKTDNYFGRVSEGVPAFRVQTKQELMVSNFFEFWGEIFLIMFALAVEYDKPSIARVCGVPDEMLADLDAYTVLDQLDVGLSFDVKELDPQTQLKKQEVIQQMILPADAEGIISRGALTMYQLKSLDPVLARQLAANPQGASQKMFNDVQLEIVKMFQGNEAHYVENDPTASAKLQFLQTIVQQNPEYMLAAFGDPRGQVPPQKPRFRELLDKYRDNLTMSVKQGDNKEVGKLGVKPGAMA